MTEQERTILRALTVLRDIRDNMSKEGLVEVQQAVGGMRAWCNTWDILRAEEKKINERLVAKSHARRQVIMNLRYTPKHV